MFLVLAVPTYYGTYVVCTMTLCLCYSLTVEEHLLFYGQLKGLSRKEVKKQIPE